MEKISKGKGRSWEMRKVNTICPYCGCGCTIELNIKENKIIKVTSPNVKSVNNGNLCVKGRFGFDFIHHPKRLKTPLIRDKDGSFKEISWHQAVNIIANKFKEIKEKFGADSIAGLSSAKCTNEENYLFQKFMRAVIGTNNVDHCARLCHAPTVAGLALAFGSGAMTNSIAEIRDADCILVTGSNTTEAHPIVALEIKKAVKAGAKLIVVDPRKIEISQYATLYLKQTPGTDVAWINGMIKVIIEEELYDKEFVNSRCEDFDLLKESISTFTLEEVEKITNIKSSDIRKAAIIFAKAKRATIIYSMGITQHTTGTDNVLSLANLAMLTGNVGFESTGVNPLRGQNNVQGACDMGALPNVFPGYQKITDEEVRAKFERAWQVPLNKKVGLTVTEMIKEAKNGKIKAMYIMGENPMLSDPDINQVEESLKNLEFLVVQDLFLTETARLAHVVLPAASFAEKEGTYTNTERRVQKINQAIPPVGYSLSDWRIISKISNALGYPMNYYSSYEIMEEIRYLTPSYAGISYERIKEYGIQWPCKSIDEEGTKFLHKDRFVRGKGKFHPVRYIPPAENPDKEYPFILTTGRMLYHFHTGSLSRRCIGLDEICSQGYVEVSEVDALELNLEEGEKIKIISKRGEIEAIVKINPGIGRGVIFIPFHFKESAANILTNPALDPKAKIPELKVAAVRVEKIE
jgi:formate dehydrogenase alpha subunit